MKFNFILILLVFFSWKSLQAQEIVQWEGVYNTSKQQIELKASISEGWHLYSQHIDNSIGPVPTSFSFQTSKLYQLVGSVEESKPVQKYDASFEAMLDFFEKEAIFSQKIKVQSDATVELTATFMVCNDEMCMPPRDQKIKIQVKK